MTTTWHIERPAGTTWSGDQPLPAVGGRVYGNMKLGGQPLGWATVEAYFTEDTPSTIYVGVVAKPDKPAPDFRKNAEEMRRRFPDHPYPAHYHLFGAELSEPPTLNP